MSFKANRCHRCFLVILFADDAKWLATARLGLSFNTSLGTRDALAPTADAMADPESVRTSITSMHAVLDPLKVRRRA